MSGLVLHPGHDELHGVTVVIAGVSGRTYLGRWHEQGARGITMRDVAIHDPVRNSVSVHDWLASQDKFGVTVTEKTMVIPTTEAREVRVFREALPGSR